MILCPRFNQALQEKQRLSPPLHFLTFIAGQVISRVLAVLDCDVAVFNFKSTCECRHNARVGCIQVDEEDALLGRTARNDNKYFSRSQRRLGTNREDASHP